MYEWMKLSPVIVCLAITSTAGSAAGEEQETETRDSPRARSRLVEEIVVTAQKREENLQDVPISINAFSADALDMRGVTNPKDLPLATPGLTTTQQAGFQLTYLRGIGTDGFFFADPSVATYIDGIYFPFGHGAAQNFGAIERIEVLKGPQGTLFGRNAVGGAISITALSPDLSALSGSVMSSYGEFNKYEGRLHINVPLTDSFAFSVSAQYSGEDPYREDGRIAGEELPEEITRGARLKLRWVPAEWLDLTLAGFRLEQHGVSSLFSPNSDPSPLARQLGVSEEDGYGGEVDAPAYFTLTNTVVYGQATANTDWFDIKLLASDQFINTSALYDFDGSDRPLAWFAVFDQIGDVQTAELQLVSSDGSWGSDWLTWIAGYYHFRGDQLADKARFQTAGSVLTQMHGLAAGLPTAGSALEFLMPVVPDGTTGTLDASGGTGTRSDSFFAQATVDVTDWFAVTLGGRYQEEQRTVLKGQGALVLPNGDELTYLSAPRLSNTTRTFKPKVSLDFRPWDGGLIYLSYQEATKSATYNIINFVPNADNSLQPDLVKPEELTAYEAGVKTDLFDGTTRLSVAAFFYELRNNQVQFISLLAGGAVTFENAPAAEVRGLDFDVTSQLFPSLIDGLVLTFSGCFLDSEYTDFPSAQGYGEDDGLYRDDLDLTGSQMSRSPRFSGVAGLSKTTAVPGGTLELGGEYYYNSGYYFLSQNNPHFQEDAFGVLGARASYLYEPWRLRLTVFGQNILDRYYSYGAMGTDFGPLTTAAPPATYGLRLNWDF